MKDDLKIIATMVGIILFLFGLIIGLSCAFEYQACDVLEVESGRNTEWQFFGGCFIEAENHSMIPKGNWRVND